METDSLNDTKQQQAEQQRAEQQRAEQQLLRAKQQAEQQLLAKQLRAEQLQAEQREQHEANYWIQVALRADRIRRRQELQKVRDRQDQAMKDYYASCKKK